MQLLEIAQAALAEAEARAEVQEEAEAEVQLALPGHRLLAADPRRPTPLPDACLISVSSV